jgi:hypothetical protein
LVTRKYEELKGDMKALLARAAEWARLEDELKDIDLDSKKIRLDYLLQYGSRRTVQTGPSLPRTIAKEAELSLLRASGVALERVAEPEPFALYERRARRHHFGQAPRPGNLPDHVRVRLADSG